MNEMPRTRTAKMDLKDFEKRMKRRQERQEWKRGQIGKYSLNEEQLQKLFATITDIRDLALLKLAAFSGIRREDIVAIELHNIDWNRGTIRFYEQKKRRQWEVWLNPDTMNVLQMYVRTLNSHERYLFPGRHQESGEQSSKNHLTGRAAYDIFQHWLTEAGLQKTTETGEYEKRPFHALRSSCIKLLARKGWTTEQIMRQTGDSLETIQLHYSVPTDSEMEDMARRTETGGVN